MWTRFGTGTRRAGSGTVEEFQRAYKKHLENPNQVKIMFYFKNAPVPPSELIPEQLARIKSFQQDLGEKGGYYRTFTSRDEFAQLVSMHLSGQVQEYGKSWGLNITASKSDSTFHTEQNAIQNLEETIYENDREDEGFLDLFEIGQENFDSMNEALLRMTNALNDLGKRAEIGGKELNELNSAKSTDIKQAKRISNRIAEALNNFAALMEVDVPVFASCYSNGIDAYSRAIAMSEDFEAQDDMGLETALKNFQEFKISTTQAKENMFMFRETVARTPRATTMYNRSRKRVLSILDILDEELSASINLASELEKVLDQLIAKRSVQTTIVDIMSNEVS